MLPIDKTADTNYWLKTCAPKFYYTFLEMFSLVLSVLAMSLRLSELGRQMSTTMPRSQDILHLDAEKWGGREQSRCSVCEHETGSTGQEPTTTNTCKAVLMVECFLRFLTGKKRQWFQQNGWHVHLASMGDRDTLVLTSVLGTVTSQCCHHHSEHDGTIMEMKLSQWSFYNSISLWGNSAVTRCPPVTQEAEPPRTCASCVQHLV